MEWRVAAWTHPGSGTFEQREHSIPFIKYQGNDPEEPRGRCTITVPETYDWQNLISVADPADPADTSLIRVYRSGVDNTGKPDVEYLLIRFQKRILDDGEAVVELYGLDWRVASLDTAVLRWHDWEPGATVSLLRDWEYGGPNLLGDGFETDQAQTPTEYEIWTDATGGTLDVGDGTDATTIAYNAAAGALEAGLEGDVTAITDVNVGGAGTEADPWTIVFATPLFGVDLEADFVNLTGETETHIDRTVIGGLNAANWVLAGTVSDGTPTVFGAHASGTPRLDTAVAHSGTYSLLVNPLDIATHGRYAGVQTTPINVTAGALYQAAIWVYTSSSTDTYRFVARTVWGAPLYTLNGDLATDTGGLGQTAYTAGTWQEVTISDIVIPPGVDQIILRFSNVDGTGNPLPWHLDDPYLARGASASTIGKISNDIIAHAKTDFAPTLVRLPFITEGDYTTADDEDGNAWPRDESITLRHGRLYGSQIYGAQVQDLGYEYDVDPGSGTGGETGPDEANWYLRIWNPGGRGTVHADLAFVVGFGWAGGLIAGRLPRATRWLAEGRGGIITEKIDTAQEAATGISEAFLGDTDITDAATLAALAQQEIDLDVANKLALTADLDDTGPIPYEHFDRGDTARFLYAGLAVGHTRRISDIALEATTDDGETTWKASVTASRLFRGGQALHEAVYKLLTEFDRLDDEETGDGPTTVVDTGGQGAQPTYTLALAGAHPNSKAHAHARLHDTADTAEGAAALTLAITRLSEGGKLVLTDGDLPVPNGSTITVPDGVAIEGFGQGVTSVIFDTNITWAMAGRSSLRHLTIDQTGG